MVANFLGLFLLILETSGISRNIQFPYNPFLQNVRGQLGVDCHYKYGPFACKDDTYNELSNSKIEKDYGRKYHKFFNPFFRHNYNIKTIPDVTVRLYENMDNNSPYVSSKKSEKSIKEQKLFNSIQITPTKSENQTQSDSYLKSNILPKSSQAAVNFAEKHLDMTDQRILDSSKNQSTSITLTSENSSNDDTTDSSEKIKDTGTSSEFITNTFAKDKLKQFSGSNVTTGDMQNEKIETHSEFTEDFIKNEREELTDKRDEQDESPFTTDDIQNGKTVTFSEFTGDTSTKNEKESVSLKYSSVIPYTTNIETKETTISQDFFSEITRETTPLVDKLKTTVNILSTNIQDSTLESTISQSSSSSTSNKDITTESKSISSEAIHISNTEQLETESITSFSSTAVPNDDTTFQTKLSSFETKPTTTKTSEDESITETLKSSSKVPLIPFTDRVTTENIKEISSTQSSSKSQITSEAITEDHIIEISSIRKARVVVTVVFLVIGLIVIVVLAVWIFRLKRKTVHYDQLMLLP